jgi:ATP-dependent Lon protease
MTSKKTISKKTNTINNTNLSNTANSFCLPLVQKKIEFFKNVVKKTILHVQKNKFFDILGISDVSSCVEKLGEINKNIDVINTNNLNNDTIVNYLQNINNDLSSILKNYGTESLDDLLLICFGNNCKIVNSEKEQAKFDMLKKYFHPTSYKLANKKEEIIANNSENIDDKKSNLICYDASTCFKQFHMKVYGIKVFINNDILKKSLIVFGIIDDIGIDFLNDLYIKDKKENIKKNIPVNNEFHNENFTSFISSLNLKDYLIYDNEYELYTKYTGYINQNQKIIQKQISHVVKEFISDDMYVKRNTLIYLLIFSSNYENQYLAYLLYDLLSNDNNGNIDTQEQTILFDSFPWSIKHFFKQAMKKTIQYTNDLSSFDINKIPLEQQICLLKTNDSVKEKAMIKLKEIKSKSEDSGTKSRQYLDGLLKIPFSVYKREPILNIMDKVRSQFKDIYIKHNINNRFPEILQKDNYTSIEILKYVKKIKQKQTSLNDIEIINNNLLLGDKPQLYKNVLFINSLFKKHNKLESKLKISNMNKNQLKNEINDFINICKLEENKELYNDLIETKYNTLICDNSVCDNSLYDSVDDINNNLIQVTKYIDEVKFILDKAVHGHDKAKKQIERIVGQWINGEQDGYCFGFEGPPGVGKTSLAKRGLSDCLKDDKGNSRPFAMIQMGGDSNGSTLHGHNYTYVASTWGSIVQILMDKKCMNPIIFIDEVDKISRTEHGKEIIGILTHLLDPAQNDCFQDKYFTGIDLDLSKALFILSYNDVDAIDKILLDRVHRIKFNSLTLEDKLIICKTHILPEVYKKMGLEDMITFDDATLKFIIDEYTLESGVRKLKEILFEIIGEINLDVLKNNIDENIILPIEINIDDIKNKYFKDKKEIITRKVPNESLVGFANGMYATSLGNGGTLPIHAKFYPCDEFLQLKLTGLQQDVMKESMHVSLTIAWNLTSEERRKEIRTIYDGTFNKFGINIHPGDAAISKNGPSAGVTITCVIYSLLNNIPIRSKIGMTGEIQMSGEVTAIGGLNYKIIGSIKAGIKEFIYPNENKNDFDEFYEKYKNDEMLHDIKFHSVSHISEVLEVILEK